MRRPSRSRPRTRRSQPTGLLVADRPFHVGPIWELRTAVLDGGELVVKRARRPSEATTALLAAEAAVLASLPEGRCVRLVGLVNPRSSHDHLLITEQVAGGALADVVGPARLDPRAVTGVLVDLSRVLAGVHCAGWMHGRIDAAHVLVGADRRVVLAGFGRARRDVQGRLGAEGRAADVAQLADLARTLLQSTTGPAAEGHAGLEAVLARIEEPDPVRRPDAAHVVELLRRFAPVPAPLPRYRPARPAASKGGHPAGTVAGDGKHPGRATSSAGDDHARSTLADGDGPVRRAPEVSAERIGGATGPADGTPSGSSPDADGPADGTQSWSSPHADGRGDRAGPTVIARRGGVAPHLLRGKLQRRSVGASRPAIPDPARSRVLAAVIGAAGVLMVAAGVLRLSDLPQRSADASASPTSGEGADAPTALPRPCEQVGSPVPPDGAVTAQVDPDGRGCTVPVHWSAGSGELTVSTPEGVRRFRLGRPGDRLVLGDWDCDGRSTPLLVRPGVDVAYRFDTWPTDSTPVEPVEVPLDPADEGTDPEPPTCG